MIRKFLLFIFMVVFSLPCSAWVFLTAVAEGENAPLLTYNIVNNKPIRVCIDFVETSFDRSNRKITRNYIPAGEKRDRYYKQVSSEITLALREYVDNARKYIEQSGRAEEFEDLKPYLNDPRVVYINGGRDAKTCEAFPHDNSAMDLRVILETNDELRSYLQGHKGSAWQGDRNFMKLFFHPDYIDDRWIDIFYYKYEDLPSSEQSSKARSILLEPTIRHEIGHTLGLGDQYMLDDINQSKEYGLSHIMPLTAINSVMGGRDKNGEIQALSCDDAEGIINLVDFYSKDVSSKRRTEGWASLCWKNIMYEECFASKISDAEYQAQLSYARSGYSSPRPDHISRIKQERRERYASAAAAQNAQQEAEEAKRRAEAAAREAEYKQKLKDLLSKEAEYGYCPVCKQPLLNTDFNNMRRVKILSAPRQKVTQGDKVFYRYPYGQCKVKIHSDCYEALKSKGGKLPWAQWCAQSKKQ